MGYYFFPLGTWQKKKQSSCPLYRTITAAKHKYRDGNEDKFGPFDSRSIGQELALTDHHRVKNKNINSASTSISLDNELTTFYAHFTYAYVTASTQRPAEVTNILSVSIPDV